jgi:hypothetical protein
MVDVRADVPGRRTAVEQFEGADKVLQSFPEDGLSRRC